MGLFDRLFKKNQAEKTDAEALNKELNDGLSKTRRGFMEKVFGGNDDFQEEDAGRKRP